MANAIRQSIYAAPFSILVRARAVWNHFWSRAPRRLSVTRDGKVVLGLALATGFAAINTGNNLLFLGWGMVLSAIVLSGLLSEATLRSLNIEVVSPGAELLRAQQLCLVKVKVQNRSRYAPGFGVEGQLGIASPQGEQTLPLPYQLRLSAGVRTVLKIRYRPSRRGAHRFQSVIGRTAYPFGFFKKDRNFPTQDTMFWVAPAKVPVTSLAIQVVGHTGDGAQGRVGLGDEFFSLRSFRDGDDPRRIHARRSARAGVPLVVETENVAARQVMIELPGASHLRCDLERYEYAVAVLGSLAEELLDRGCEVGVRAPGIWLSPASDVGQNRRILIALAQLDPVAPMLNRALGQNVVRLTLGLASSKTSQTREDLFKAPISLSGPFGEAVLR